MVLWVGIWDRYFLFPPLIPPHNTIGDEFITKSFYKIQKRKLSRNILCFHGDPKHLAYLVHLNFQFFVS